MEKCAGCDWIGPEHDAHLAQAIETAIGEAIRGLFTEVIKDFRKPKPPNQTKEES